MIICIGESLIDFVPGPTSELPAVVASSAGDVSPLPPYRPVAGGSPFNCAIAAARLGATVGFAGTVATDFFGDQIVRVLEANGVELSMVTRVDNPTTLAFVRKDPHGAARYAFYTNDAADRALTREDLPAELPSGALLQMGSISIIADPEGSTILDLAEREHGRRVIVFDPNIRESLIADSADYRDRLKRALRVATILKTSDEDLRWIFPDTSTEVAVGKALEAGVSLVVLTKGAEGSGAYTARSSVEVAAERVDVSDTIGAGDSFMAALLTWVDERGANTVDAVATLSTEELRDALVFASRVAGITCTRVGADPPRRDELR
ncbi:MAG: carbohydrate kinase family protein [Spirochaetota bacterium]